MISNYSLLSLFYLHWIEWDFFKILIWGIYNGRKITMFTESNGLLATMHILVTRCEILLSFNIKIKRNKQNWSAWEETDLVVTGCHKLFFFSSKAQKSRNNLTKGFKMKKKKKNQSMLRAVTFQLCPRTCFLIIYKMKSIFIEIKQRMGKVISFFMCHDNTFQSS